MKQFLIQFKHNSRRLGYDGIGQLLITAETFEEACERVPEFGIVCENEATGYKWVEHFDNAKEFINLTI